MKSKSFCFFFSYVLSNGYKPAPYDIAIVQLGPVMSKLVELLAENTHNIWAEAKIARSWTHGAQDVSIDQ